MQDEQELQEISAIFSVLGNSTRLKIIETVRQTERPLHIRALAQALKKDYAAIYRHVRVLAKSGVIGIYEVGRSRVIYLKNANIVKESIGIAKKML